jgi:predicted MPP superfamily phosphohydrolase
VARLLALLRTRTARTILLALVGAVAGLALAGRSQATIGPFECSLRATPSLSGETRVLLAPLGSIRLDTHTGPVAVELRVDELRPEDAARIAEDPTVLAALEDELVDDARDALQGLAVRSAAAVVLGGLLGAIAGRVSVRNAMQGLAVGGVVAALAGLLVAVTFRAEAVREPRYTGLLTIAPQAVGDVGVLFERFDDYSAQLTDLVGNVAAIYRTADALPRLDPGDDAIRVLHVSDLHNNPQGFDLALEMVEQFDVDAVVDTGDITDWGTGPETALLERIGDFDVPYVYVRGNHDSQVVQEAVAAQGAIVLDGASAEVAGLRIWGDGDPRFTPDRSEVEDQQAQAERIDRFADGVRRQLRREEPGTVDVVALHDPRAADEIGDLVPLVLSGHRHEPAERTVGDALQLVEGSTGGAGLRGLQGEGTEPLTCTVLYFDPDTRRLVAYDRVSVDSFGGAAARIERHVLGGDGG